MSHIINSPYKYIYPPGKITYYIPKVTEFPPYFDTAPSAQTKAYNNQAKFTKGFQDGHFSINPRAHFYKLFK